MATTPKDDDLVFKKISRHAEFQRDVKKLKKRYRSLENDLTTFIQAQLIPYHKLGVDNGGIFRISDLGIKNPAIYKAKKFACRFLKGRGSNSGIRVIYAYSNDEIVLIEMYFKGDKESEDRERIRRHYGGN